MDSEVEVPIPHIGISPLSFSKFQEAQEGAETFTQLIEEFKYDYVTVPVSRPMYKDKARLGQPVEPLTLQDVSMLPNKYASRMVGLLAPITAHCNIDKVIQVILNEVEYAKFLGVGNLVFSIHENSGFDFSIEFDKILGLIKRILEMISTENMILSFTVLYEDSESKRWDLWNAFRIALKYNSRFKVYLQLPGLMSLDPNTLGRWFSEPVQFLSISSSYSFIEGDDGKPAVRKFEEIFLKKFIFKQPIFLILYTDLNLVHEHVSYLKPVYQALTTEPNEEDIDITARFSISHYDTLLEPLEPLYSNLDDCTYTTFQQDSVKYLKYEQAVEARLRDYHVMIGEMNFLIVGAGKGGLIQSCLRALSNFKNSENVDIKVNLIAVEKNNSAVIYLNYLNETIWNNQVQIIRNDIRDVDFSQFIEKSGKFHFIISELLGSFGCNELSPECLLPLTDTVDENFGVFIPESYSNSVTPIFSSELFAKINNNKKSESDLKGFNKPYVVKLYSFQNCCDFAGDIWGFEHVSGKKFSLDRDASCSFKIEQNFNSIVHGFAGFFTAKLYKNIEISTKPKTHTKDLISWFPYFFPLEDPISISKGDRIKFNIKRQSDSGGVWYEWQAINYTSADHRSKVVSKVHNELGWATKYRLS